MDDALADWPLVTLDAGDRLRTQNGAPLFNIHLAGARCRAHDEHGRLIALLVFDQQKKWWRAEKVFTMNNTAPLLGSAGEP